MAENGKKIKTENKPAAQAPAEAEKKPVKTAEQKSGGHAGRNFLLLVIAVLAAAALLFDFKCKQTAKADGQALAQLQSTYEQKLGAVSARVDALQKELDGVKGGLSASAAESKSDEEYINERMEQIKQDLLQYQAAALTSSAEAESKTADQPQDTAETAENTQGTQSTPAAVQPAVCKQSAEMLLASGAIIVNEMAEQGEKFEYEAEVLQILAQGNSQAEGYVSVMRKYAASGLKGRNALIKTFDRIFAELNSAKIKPEAPAQLSFKEKTLRWIKKIFISKKSRRRPSFNENTDAVYAAVNEGRLAEALNAMKTDPEYSAVEFAPLAQWQADAAEYLEFKHAANSLIMNSLANIRLKEMEH